MKITMVRGKTISFDAGDVLRSLGMSPEHRFSEVIGNFLEKTKDILSDIMTGPMPENVKIEKILSSVAKKYGISVDDLKGKKRSREIAMARHIAIYIIRTIVEKSYPDIGKIFNRDHSTVLASYDLIANKMKEDVILESEVNDLIKEISVL